MRQHYIVYFLACMLAFLSCKKEQSPDIELRTVELTGKAEKGPFLKGSKVTVVELSPGLMPTGRTFASEVYNDLGHFEISNLQLETGYVQVLVEGFYFDEARGAASVEPITLGSLARLDISESPQITVNVNVLTHLEQERVRKLVKEGATFSEAKIQAGKELLAVFYLHGELSRSTDQISLTDNDKDALYLLAISSALLHDTSPSILADRISTIVEQFGLEGRINESDRVWMGGTVFTPALKQSVAHVTQHYASLGSEIEFIDFFVLEYPDFTDPNFDEDDFSMAYRSVQTMFFDYFQSFAVFEAAYSNKINPTTGPYRAVAAHQVDPSNRLVFSLWSKAYQAINAYNTFLKHAEEIDLPIARELVHALHAHRAYLYWTLMTLWGDVPYRDPAETGTPTASPRTSTDYIINQLVPTLESAVQFLSVEANAFGVSKSFPLAVLARLALFVGDHATAKQYSEQIIASNIFELSHISWAPGENVYGALRPQGILSDASQEYQRFIHNGEMIQAITYPEVVLAASEACLGLGEINKALEYLNMVRRSSGKQILSTTDHAILREALLEEISAELGKDGLWFSALKRLGNVEQVLAIPAYRKLLPIPSEEVVFGVATQNPGY